MRCPLCNKTTYTSKAVAKAEAFKLKRTRKRNLIPYACPLGVGFHLKTYGKKWRKS